MYETGAMRRVHLRGRENILKRLLVHGAAFNLSMIMRKVLGAGKPREFQSLYAQVFNAILGASKRFFTPEPPFNFAPRTLHCKAA
jgi:hypothetical protein